MALQSMLQYKKPTVYLPSFHRFPVSLQIWPQLVLLSTELQYWTEWGHVGRFIPSICHSLCFCPGIQVHLLDYPQLLVLIIIFPDNSVRAAFHIIVAKPSHKGLLADCEEVTQDWQCTHLSWEKICTWQCSMSHSVLINILLEKCAHCKPHVTFFISYYVTCQALLLARTHWTCKFSEDIGGDCSGHCFSPAFQHQFKKVDSLANNTFSSRSHGVGVGGRSTEELTPY